jgi:hypothetical protein
MPNPADLMSFPIKLMLDLISSLRYIRIAPIENETGDQTAKRLAIQTLATIKTRRDLLKIGRDIMEFSGSTTIITAASYYAINAILENAKSGDTKDSAKCDEYIDMAGYLTLGYFGYRFFAGLADGCFAREGVAPYLGAEVDTILDDNMRPSMLEDGRLRISHLDIRTRHSLEQLSTTITPSQFVEEVMNRLAGELSVEIPLHIVAPWNTPIGPPYFGALFNQIFPFGTFQVLDSVMPPIWIIQAIICAATSVGPGKNKEVMRTVGGLIVWQMTLVFGADYGGGFAEWWGRQWMQNSLKPAMNKLIAQYQDYYASSETRRLLVTSDRYTPQNNTLLTDQEREYFEACLTSTPAPQNNRPTQSFYGNASL